MRFFTILILSSLWVGCSQKKTKEVEKNELLNISKYQVKDMDSIFSLKLHLLPKNKDSIVAWKSYWRLENLLEDYATSNSKEFLNIAEELYTESQKLNDSLKVKELRTRGMLSRLNTLETLTFRLKDMKSISSISDMEIRQQTLKIYDVFDIITSKINAIYKQKRFEENLEFDEEFFLNDSIGID